MAFVNKLTKILLLLAIFSSRAFANLDCGGKPFLCVNATHFNICVDFGNSISFTVDNFIIPCPPGTECSAKNHFECEIPAPTIPAAIDITNDGKAKEERSVSITPMWEVVKPTVPVLSVNDAEYSEKYLNTESSSSLSNSATIGPSQPATTVPIELIVFSEITNNSVPAVGDIRIDTVNSQLHNVTSAGPFNLPPIKANDTGPFEYSLTSATTTEDILSTVRPIIDSYTTENYIPNEISANVNDNNKLQVTENIMQSDKPAIESSTDPIANFSEIQFSTKSTHFDDQLATNTENVTKNIIEDLKIFPANANKETVQNITTSIENTTKGTIQNTTNLTGSAIKATNEDLTTSTESVTAATIQDTTTSTGTVGKATIQNVISLTENATKVIIQNTTSITESESKVTFQDTTSFTERATKELIQDVTTESINIVTQTPAKWIDSKLVTISKVLSSVPASNEPVLITFEPQNSSQPIEWGILTVDSPTILNATTASGLPPLVSSTNISETVTPSWSKTDVARTPTINLLETTVTTIIDGAIENYTSLGGENINPAELAQESSTKTYVASKLYDTTQPITIEKSTENVKIENLSIKSVFEITTKQNEITFKSTKSDLEIPTENRPKENQTITPVFDTTTKNIKQSTATISNGETSLQNPSAIIIFNYGNNPQDNESNTNNNSTGSNNTKNEDKDITSIVDNSMDSIRQISNMMNKTFVDVKRDESSTAINILFSTNTETTQNGDEAPNIYSNMVIEDELLSKLDKISPDNADTPIYIEDVIGGNLPWQGPKEQNIVESPGQLQINEVPANGGVNKTETELGFTEKSASENLSTADQVIIPLGIKPLQISDSGNDNTGSKATLLGLNFNEATASTEPTIKITTDSIVVTDATHTYTMKVPEDKIHSPEKNDGDGNLLSTLSEVIERGHITSDATIISSTTPTHIVKPAVNQTNINKTEIYLLSNEPRETRQTMVKHEHLSASLDDSTNSRVTTNQEQTSLPAIVKTITEKESIQESQNSMDKIYTSSPSQIVVPISTKPSIEVTKSTTLESNVIATPPSTTNDDVIITQSMLSLDVSTDSLYLNGDVTSTSISTETAIPASAITNDNANNENEKLSVDTIYPKQSIDVTTMTTTTMGDKLLMESSTAASDSIQVAKVTMFEVNFVSPSLLSQFISSDVTPTTESVGKMPERPAPLGTVENGNEEQIVDSVTTEQIENKVLMATTTILSHPVATSASKTSPVPVQVTTFTPSEINPDVGLSSVNLIGDMFSATESIETKSESPVSQTIVANKETIKSVDELTTQQGYDKVLTATLSPLIINKDSKHLQVTSSISYKLNSDIFPSSTTALTSEEVSFTEKTTLESPVQQGIVANEDIKHTDDALTTEQAGDMVLTPTTMPLNSIVVIEDSTIFSEAIQTTSLMPLDFSSGASPPSNSAIISGDVSSTTENIKTMSANPSSQSIVTNEGAAESIDGLSTHHGIEVTSTKTNISSISTNRGNGVTEIILSKVGSNVQRHVSSTSENSYERNTSSYQDVGLIGSQQAVIGHEKGLSIAESSESSTTENANQKITSSHHSFNPIGSQEEQGVIRNEKGEHLSLVVSNVSSTIETANQKKTPTYQSVGSIGSQQGEIGNEKKDRLSIAESSVSSTTKTTNRKKTTTYQNVSHVGPEKSVHETIAPTISRTENANQKKTSTHLSVKPTVSQQEQGVIRNEKGEHLSIAISSVSSTIETTNQKKTPTYQSVGSIGSQQGGIGNGKDDRLSIAESSVSSTTETANQKKTTTYQTVGLVGSEKGVFQTLASTISRTENGERVSLTESSGATPKVTSSDYYLITPPVSLNEHSSVSQTTINVKAPANPTEEAKISINSDSYGLVESVLKTFLFSPSTGKEMLQTGPSSFSIKSTFSTTNKPKNEKDTEANINKDAAHKSIAGNSKAESTTVKPIVMKTTVSSKVSKANSSINVANSNKETQLPEVRPKATSAKPKVKNPSAPKPTFNCTYLPRGRYSDENDCRKFYICIDKPHPIVGHCPVNTVFSEIKKQCVRNLSHCIRGNEFKCAAHGRFVDYKRENIYYVCVRSANIFLRFKFQCQTGYILDRTAVRCKQNVNSRNGPVSISDSVHNKEKSQWTKSVSSSSGSSSKKSSDGNVENEFTCKKVGHFPHQSDSRKYYICYKTKKSELKKKVVKCDSDEVFNPDKKKCVDDDSEERQL